MQRFSIRLQGITPYLKLIRLHQPTGILLLLWPCWWSIALATPHHQWPDLSLLAIFCVGAILMRGTGCIVNDLWDKDIDAKVTRTKTRALASGQIRPKQAILFLGLLLVAGFLLLLQLNTTTQILGVCSLMPVALYPLMKRIFPLPQLFLGLTFSWGALMGWTAVTNSFDWPMVWMYLAAISWTVGYDTIYAVQDKADDERIGVHSSARLFGEKVKPIVAGCYGLTVFFLLLAEHSLPYLGAVFVFAAQLLWQVQTVNLAQPQAAMAIFKSNGWAGAVVFAGILLG